MVPGLTKDALRLVFPSVAIPAYLNESCNRVKQFSGSKEAELKPPGSWFRRMVKSYLSSSKASFRPPTFA
jgi:hypothetical protein